MCISDLNPQMQFQNLNLSSKIISPIIKHHHEPPLEASTGTPHLAATRPPRAVRAANWKSWTANWLTTSWPTWPTSPTASTSTSFWTSMPTASIQELGVTRSYEEYHNEFIHRLEVEALEALYSGRLIETVLKIFQRN